MAGLSGFFWAVGGRDEDGAGGQPVWRVLAGVEWMGA